MSPPPHGMPTTEPAFIEWQSTIWGKKLQATTKVTVRSHQWSHEKDIFFICYVWFPTVSVDFVSFVLMQVLPHDSKARRLFVTSGGLKKIQEIKAEPGSALAEYINAINNCYPEEIVKYVSQLLCLNRYGLKTSLNGITKINQYCFRSFLKRPRSPPQLAPLQSQDLSLWPTSTGGRVFVSKKRKCHWPEQDLAYPKLSLWTH